ncbi:MAG: translocation/assembly module TamB domain-containing protein, partial [Planctomycetota bacterium]
AAVDAWLGAGARGAATLETTSLEELRKLVPDVRETGGRLSATVDLAGSLGAPELTGSARLTEGTFRYRGVPPVVGAELEIEVSGDGITLTRGDLEVGSAPVALTGKVLMGQGNPRIVGATVKGSNVLLVRSRDARVRADLDLEIDGRVADLTVRGDVVLREGRIRSPIEFQSLLEGGGAAPPTVSRGIELPAFGPPSVALALKVRTADPIRLEGRIARGGLRAELDVGGTAAEPRPTGSVFFDPLQLAVPAGTIDFTAGLVTFRPEDPELPTLDLVGETRLAGYDVTITVSGEYDRAEVELTSSPALSPDDLLLLVLTGQPPAAGAGLEAAGQSVALYVAKDLVRGWFASGGFEDEDRESFLDRLEVTTGRDVSRAGVLTVEATYRLKEGLARDKDALYVVLERDTYEDYGLGLRLVLRLD